MRVIVTGQVGMDKKLYLEEKLQASGWNVKKTAEALQMQRSNLYKKIEKYGLKRR